MNRSSTRLVIITSLFILVSLACNVPIINQIQSNFAPADDDTGSTSPSDGTTAEIVDSGSTAPSNTDGAELTYIPAATFLMGSATSDLLADEDEMPQHQIDVDDFWIYTHEVTNQMYAACIDAGGCMGVETLDSGPTSHFEDPAFQDYPVVGVDWVMARNYCVWAGGRLPTEAEWELASRGPESLLYPWGEEEPTCDQVNMGGCAVPPDTQQVGHYLLGNSPDGVWDLSGNVWEWVHDWYADDYYAQSPADNPVGPLDPQDPDKPLRVIRGGGLYSEPVRMRSASRLGINPYRPFDDVGFRCVTGEGLALPADYDPGEDWHERVPPGRADGGDRADDPDRDLHEYSLRVGPITGPCPDFEGQIHLMFVAISRPPADMISAFFTFPDAPFDIPCDYDEAAGVATCEGLAPPGYLDPPPTFPLDICFADIEWGRCVYGVRVLKPTDCEEDSDSLEVELRPLCDPDVDGSLIPSFQVIVSPVTAPFEGASTDAGPLTCEDIPFVGAYSCHDLPGSPGELLTVDVAFADGRIITETVRYPNCDGEHARMLRLTPDCVGPPGAMTEIVIIEYFGVEADFMFATANDVLLTCFEAGVDTYHCQGLPGGPGDDLMVTANFSDETSMTQFTTFPTCDEPVDFVDPFALAQVGCQGESEYYAVIDTFITDEIASWSLEGVESPLDCGPADPPRPGRFYCNFAIRDWYTTLTFCVEIVGTGEYCETFDNDDFGERLPETCGEPSDDGGGDDCSNWTNFNDCVGNGCIWENDACHD